MTLSVSLIPNEENLFLMQDSEITYEVIALTQDIAQKVARVNDHAIAGVIGNPNLGNEVLELMSHSTFTNNESLRRAAEEAYHRVREIKLYNGVLRPFGLTSMDEVVKREKGLEETVRERLIQKASDSRGFGLDLMFCYNYEEPQIYSVGFPGTGNLQRGPKAHSVRGSGQLSGIDVVGRFLEDFRWQTVLSRDDAVFVMMMVANDAERYVGVGGPYDLWNVESAKKKPKITSFDRKKFNMGVYVVRYADAGTVHGLTGKILDENVSVPDFAEHVRSKVHGLGIEFDKEFKL